MYKRTQMLPVTIEKKLISRQYYNQYFCTTKLTYSKRRLNLISMKHNLI